MPEDGLSFPPCGVDDLAHVLRPKAIGGVIDRDGMVEVVSSLERDGRPVFRDLRWGVYVVLKAPNDYAARLLQAIRAADRFERPLRRHVQALPPDRPGTLDLGPQRGAARRADRRARAWRGDAVAVAKRDLKAGESLDGEGGYTVYGKVVPAARSRALEALPIGLAHRVPLTQDVAAGTILTEADVRLPRDSLALSLRQSLAS